ncbi:MAG: DUF423 domain-containing protein [Rhodospirillaceae bacterium]|nr:DUF423 domain-containing protein [Rhodospirillaceae bacterium]
MERSDWWRFFAGLLGAAGVALAATAAHAIPDAAAATAVERAALVLVTHGATLLALASLRGRAARLSKIGLLAGSVLFSGSIALRHLAAVEGATALTPYGGICLILAWLCAALTAFRR